MSEFTSTPRLVLLPAVDVAGGKAVRLTQGEAGSETSYGDPVDAAQEWITSRFPGRELNIGLDAAILIGFPANITVGIILVGYFFNAFSFLFI